MMLFKPTFNVVLLIYVQLMFEAFQKYLTKIKRCNPGLTV